MKSLQRNKREFYYSNYAGKKPVLDDSGYETGEYEIMYTPPLRAKANISAAQGETQIEQFGTSITYDRVIVTTKRLPIDENSILWVDVLPDFGNKALKTERGKLINSENGEVLLAEDAEAPGNYDYIVKKVATSLNSMSIAISKVDVS